MPEEYTPANREIRMAEAAEKLKQFYESDPACQRAANDLRQLQEDMERKRTALEY